MSGVAILRALLAAHPPVRAIITNHDSIVGGVLPQGGKVPALSVHTIGENEEPTTARGLSTKMLRERVQVTALARDWAVMKRLIKAAALGPGVHTGVVLGIRVRSILPEGVGPEIPRDDGIYEQSRDYVVTFIEAN